MIRGRRAFSKEKIFVTTNLGRGDRDVVAEKLACSLNGLLPSVVKRFSQIPTKSPILTVSPRREKIMWRGTKIAISLNETRFRWTLKQSSTLEFPQKSKQTPTPNFQFRIR